MVSTIFREKIHKTFNIYINIVTDARIKWTRVHREFFVESPGQFDPVIPGNTYIKELEKFYIEKFDFL